MVFMVDWIRKPSDKYKLRESPRKCKFHGTYIIIKIYHTSSTFRTPPFSLTCETHYEKMIEMFDRKGYFCTTVQEIQHAIKSSLKASLLLHVFEIIYRLYTE